MYFRREDLHTSGFELIFADDLYGVQATADHFGVKMYVITSYREGEIIEINPNGPLRSERMLYLSFWAEVILKAPAPAL